MRVAVVGLGRAGRARVRAIESLPGVELVARVVREGEPTLEEVLADPAVDALVVSTPNGLHAGMVRRALDAGKHVAVEYPVATDPDEARALFARARERNRILHVEHIELLSQSQDVQRRRTAGLGRPVGGTLAFRGAAEGWLLDPARAGTPAVLSLARLHRLVDLFGEASVTSARLEGDLPRYRLSVELAFAAGGSAGLVEERGPGEGRRTHWDIQCEHGTLDNPPRTPSGGSLFLRDTEHFVRRVRAGVAPYVTEVRVVQVLELVRASERGAVP